MNPEENASGSTLTDGTAVRSTQNWRPKTLAKVAQLAAAGDSFDRWLANFRHDFYSAPTAAALTPTPGLLAPKLCELGRVQDAYLAATAEHLACAHGLPIPAWVGSEDRKLHRPWFASPLAALRAVLILESPAAFRSRNLLISENALTRA
ncbi:hypothetical protein LBMAG56_31600 [Verrucomicrobiota bacterium]|nr:hypothetical protein LBMAG56_31600 [Verrucomicrobiota bacterium]